MGKEIKIDLKDRKILYELDINARRSNSQIAEKVGLSKEVVNYRIKRMIEEGIIKGFIAIIDTTKMDFLLFRAFLKFHNLTPIIEKEILSYLEKNVSWYVKIKGNWDVNFAKWTRSIYEFMDFWNDFVSKYGAYLEKEWISTLTKMWHYRRAYLLNKKIDNTKFDLWGENPEQIKIDDLDYKILKILATNARMSSVEIAFKIGTTERSIRYRIKRLLEEKIILGFRAFLDINKLGHQYYKIHFHLRDSKLKNNLFEYAHHHPNIIYATDGVGCADFELDVQVKNNEELYKLIDMIIEKFGDMIRDYEFMQYVEEYKFVYLPEN